MMCIKILPYSSTIHIVVLYHNVISPLKLLNLTCANQLTTIV